MAKNKQTDLWDTLYKYYMVNFLALYYLFTTFLKKKKLPIFKKM